MGEAFVYSYVSKDFLMYMKEQTIKKQEKSMEAVGGCSLQGTVRMFRQLWAVSLEMPCLVPRHKHRLRALVSETYFIYGNQN